MAYPALFNRRDTTPVRCGNVIVGGKNPVSIQTMTKCDTRDVASTVEEIRRAVDYGAQLVRVAVVDQEAARAIESIKQKVACPIVADIHFDYKLALVSLEAGADKVRVNPGNLGGKEPLLKVAKKAMEKGAAIRLGINSGSLEKDILEAHGAPTPQAMVESARRHLRYLEDAGVDNIVLSLKSSSVKDTIEAYMLMAEFTKWPFHIGITEAGPGEHGIIKSAAGIGTLLALGLGDTVRVSLTGPSYKEVQVAKEILQSVGLASYGPDIISCPTCGRTQVDVVSIARQVADALQGITVPLKVAVMGCPVNGPGEAREADIGVACGRDGGILFARGKVLGRVSSQEIVPALVKLAREYAQSPEGKN
ncbi:MAG TPA: 4-hydroxy-3-methylbut-2-en-1-yl diphosphate synthase [Clostridiales bacterium UBA9857]|nr:4-hydroxy-3-methylbut-2-en-1-yl diphosphate synthase [Clostridiales bacterium UBA9857]